MNRADVRKWAEHYELENFHINRNGTVDVDGDVDIHYDRSISIRKLPIQFGYVAGDFDASFSRLVSLAGSPREVGGNFICTWNDLTSLDGSPHEVGRVFDCSHNQLTSIDGCAQVVGTEFLCCDNVLSSLHGAPAKIGSVFWCRFNPQLQNIEGLRTLPTRKKGTFMVDTGTLNDLVSFSSLDRIKEILSLNNFVLRTVRDYMYNDYVYYRE